MSFLLRIPLPPLHLLLELLQRLCNVMVKNDAICDDS